MCFGGWLGFQGCVCYNKAVWQKTYYERKSETRSNAAAKFLDSKDGFIVIASRDLSVRLCGSYCVQYKQSLSALARVSGNAFPTGADIPTSEDNQGRSRSL